MTDTLKARCEWCGLGDATASVYYVGGDKDHRATEVHWGCLRSMFRVLHALEGAAKGD